MAKIRLSSMIVIILCLGLVVFAVSITPANSVYAQEEGPVVTPQSESPLDKDFSIQGLSGNSVLINEIISAGDNYTCGVKRDGTIACWGRNWEGQATPPTGFFIQVSAGYEHTCGLKNDKSIKCWGNNDYGQSTPPSGTFKQVSVGVDFACGVRTTGTIKCWGVDNYGQSTPPTGTFLKVSVGNDHACGLKTSGGITCWGLDDEGQATPPSGTFIQVSAGWGHSCGVKSNGLVVCWGNNDYNKSTPPSGTFIQVSAGLCHTCGVKSNSTLACWGNNNYNQSAPLPSGTFIQVSAGDDHTCGIRTDGYAACRGSNSSGQSYPPHTLFGPSKPQTTPTTYRPSGDTYTTKPTYSWSRISGATSYRLVVYRITPAATVVDKTVSSTACSTTTNRCSYTPTTALTNTKSYKWKVLATNALGSGPYSAYRTFKVLPGFNSTFNGTYTGWLKHPGGSWFITSSVFYTNGAAGKYSSASYNATFKDFTYQARVKQPSTNSSSFSGLVVRGYPTFNSLNNWTSGLFFVTNKDGKFKVYKTVSGTSTTLKNWTSSTYIVKSNWNTLKVTADGSHYRFYINGHLVWNGTDTSRSSGRAGLITYSKSTAEKFYTDWAKLTMSDYYNK